VKERPILFSGVMVQAILAGRKTQTRRVVKFGKTIFKGVTGQVQSHYEYKACYPMPAGGFVFWSDPVGKAFSDRAYKGETGGYRCPYGEPGDRLWVRETWRAEELDDSGLDGVLYAADNQFLPIENTPEAADAWGKAHFNKHGNPYGSLAWRPSIFMPRWASRIMLEILNVRIERVQDISESDAIAEGALIAYPQMQHNPQAAFATLWDEINFSRGFGIEVNPWVWVVNLRCCDAGA
jgi:hypothetical protein